MCIASGVVRGRTTMEAPPARIVTAPVSARQMWCHM